MKNRNDRSTSRPSISRDADGTAGDQGLEEHRSASASDPGEQSNEQMESSPRQKRNSNVRTDDVRDLNSIDRTTARRRGSESSDPEEEQSGQKSSGRVFKMGPARSGKVSEDESLSGDRKNLGSSRQDKSSSSSSNSSSRSSSSDRSDRSDRPNEDLNRKSRDLDRSKM